MKHIEFHKLGGNITIYRMSGYKSSWLDIESNSLILKFTGSPDCEITASIEQLKEIARDIVNRSHFVIKENQELSIRFR
jgi:hypothetical protein